MANLKKNILKILVLSIVGVMLSLGIFTTVSAEYNFGDPTQLNDAILNVTPEIVDTVEIVVSILLYVSIMIVGINIIIYRNKPEERSDAMKGLFYIAIGVLIISSAYLIYNMIVNFIE